MSQAVPPSEFSDAFVQGMKNRMGVSYFKYGPIRDAFPFKVDALASLQQRIAEYKRTGNTEFLIDAANFAMIEFLLPSKADAHYTPTDSDASPGRKTWSGKTTSKDNATLEFS